MARQLYFPTSPLDPGSSRALKKLKTLCLQPLGVAAQFSNSWTACSPVFTGQSGRGF